MVQVVQQTPEEGSSFFLLDRVATRKRNASTAREASLKLGRTYDVREQAVASSPSSTSQWYNI